MKRALRWSLLLVAACATGDTSKLSPELMARFTREGILRRADNVTFRWTLDPGEPRARWDDRVGSILVTRATVYIHKNDRVGIEITPRSRRAYKVERAGDRVRIRAGTGHSEELWSFIPPDGDARGWTSDIRSVIRLADTTSNAHLPDL